jgi:hypothetical protein
VREEGLRSNVGKFMRDEGLRSYVGKLGTEAFAAMYLSEAFNAMWMSLKEAFACSYVKKRDI